MGPCVKADECSCCFLIPAPKRPQRSQWASRCFLRGVAEVSPGLIQEDKLQRQTDCSLEELGSVQEGAGRPLQQESFPFIANPQPEFLKDSAQEGSTRVLPGPKSPGLLQTISTLGVKLHPTPAPWSHLPFPFSGSKEQKPQVDIRVGGEKQNWKKRKQPYPFPRVGLLFTAAHLSPLTACLQYWNSRDDHLHNKTFFV